MDTNKTLGYDWEYGHEEVAIRVSSYRNNGNLYVGLCHREEGEWEDFGDVTINLPFSFLEPNEAYITGDFTKDTIYEVNLFMQTSYIQREPSDVFQTLQQSSAEVSKEKIAHGMKETDPGVFASVLTESVQKSIDKNSYGDPVTVTVKVEKNHSRTYELSETERSKLETAMFPTE
ncbi:DUF4313 domain-containing protein [Lacrimispora saccharolytica]|nr:DUF4313 domain-containing protein [Lacrimispora saccharolytica]